MSQRKILILVVVVLILGATFVALKFRMQTAEPEVAAPAPEPTAERILVAKKDIPTGTFVYSAQDLDWAAWPAETIQPQHIKEGAEQITNYDGAVARRSVKAGDAITANELIKPGSGGFLAAVLEPGRRAMSIAVSPTTGTSGFIFPGDHVDLLITHRVKMKQTEQASEEESVVSETFVEDVRVVAVDQMLDNPDNKAILAKTVTVEVTPEQAEKVSVAEQLGTIGLALRSLARDDQAKKALGGPELPAPTATDDALMDALQQSAPVHHNYTRDADVSRVLDRSNGATPRVLVIRGDQTERREFYKEGGAQ